MFKITTMWFERSRMGLYQCDNTTSLPYGERRIFQDKPTIPVRKLLKNEIQNIEDDLKQRYKNNPKILSRRLRELYK